MGTSQRLRELTWEWYATTPFLAAMKGHPEYEGWGTAVERFAETPGLEPLHGVLQGLAKDALLTMQPLKEFLDHEVSSIPAGVFMLGARTSRTAVESCPPAAFILAYVCAHGWMTLLGTALYDQDETGRARPPWTIIPQALAFVGLQLGTFHASLRIAEEAYDVLYASKLGYHFWQPIRDAMDECRMLAHECSAALERSVRDLADDLRSACGSASPNVRAEFGAILWTLGLIPQSMPLQTVSDALPSHRLARQVVRRSIERMRHDGLLQYVWLELKNNSAIHVREHAEIFAILNNRFPESETHAWMQMFTLLQGARSDPASIYARTLIEWFRGTLAKGDKDSYIRLVAYLSQQESPTDPALMLLRMMHLASSIGRACGWPEGFSADRSEDLRLMRTWIDDAGALRRKLTLYPELPDPQAAMNMSLHEVIEQELGEGGGGEALARVWDALEGFRGSALEYWMAVTRPLPGEEEAKSAGSPRKRRKADATKATDRGLLAREDELIKWLRGAWFLVLHDSLPRHFERYAAESSVFQAFRERGPGLSTEVGRKEYSQVKKQLEELHQEMVAVMPLYARKRQQKWAGWTDLVSAATAHQRHGQRAQSHTR